MASWASILQQIGTPLQFAALFLLVIGGVAYTLITSGKWKPSSAIARLLINRIFQAGVAALALGLLAPLIPSLMEQWTGQQIVYGTVLSLGGDAVPQATVKIVPIGEASTNGLGQFSLSIPHNRLEREYHVLVSAPNFKSAESTRSDEDLRRGVEIRLTPAPPELLRELGADFYVSQNYGAPGVVVNLHVKNVGSATRWISEITGTIRLDGAMRTLTPVSWTITNPLSQYAPMNGSLPIFAGADLNLRVFLSIPFNLNGLNEQLASLPDYRSRSPCMQTRAGGFEPLTDPAFEIVKAFSENQFAWKSGEWEFTVSAKADDEAKVFTRKFALSDADVDLLRRSITLAQRCLSTNWLYPLVEDGNLADFVQKN